MTNGSPVLRVRPTLAPLLVRLLEVEENAKLERKRDHPSPAVLRQPDVVRERILDAAVALVQEALTYRPIVTPSPAASPEGGVGLAGALE